jgi:hypothetical protein
LCHNIGKNGGRRAVEAAEAEAEEKEEAAAAVEEAEPEAGASRVEWAAISLQDR